MVPRWCYQARSGQASTGIHLGHCQTDSMLHSYWEGPGTTQIWWAEEDRLIERQALQTRTASSSIIQRHVRVAANINISQHHHHHHGGPSVSRMTLSVPLICGYGSGSAGRSWTCRAVRSLGTGSSHLSLGYRLPSGGVLWRIVLDGDALPLAQMTQIVKVCASAVCSEQ